MDQPPDLLALRFDFWRTTDEMMNDPQLTGDILLLALGILHEINAAKSGRVESKKSEYWVRIARHIWLPVAYEADPDPKRTPFETRRLYAEKATEQLWVQLRHVVAQDAPRYDPDAGRPRRHGHPACEGPMQRRPGPCGQPGSHMQTSIIDPDTGERRMVGTCKNPAHVADLNRRLRETRDQWEQNRCPQPPANAGGLLPRYFSYGKQHSGWVELYDWATHGRYKTEVIDGVNRLGKPLIVPYYRAIDGRAPELTRPKLTLVPTLADA